MKMIGIFFSEINPRELKISPTIRCLFARHRQAATSPFYAESMGLTKYYLNRTSV